MNDDEKLCPFCAETIKAAAVKCRFCQSDLPTDAPAVSLRTAPEELTAGPGDEDVTGSGTDPATEARPDPGPEADAAPAAPEPAAGATGVRSPAVLRVALGVVSLALATGSAWFFTHDRVAERSDGLTLGGDQQVVTKAFREEAERAAREKATAILSYSYRTFDQDEAKAKALMAPGFAAEYATAMAQNRKTAVDGKITQRATVVGASLASLQPRSAKVLVFVDLATTAGDSPTPRSGKERALMSMTRKDGAWIVTDMDAF